MLKGEGTMGYLGRDVEVVSINQEQYLVASCDSCGSIGMKQLDVLKIPWPMTGRLTTRVALLEVLSTGAVPQMMTVAISNEPHPTGDRILEGVKEELESFGLSTLPMAISTEKNMLTQQTGLGVSVMGVTKKKQLRICTALAGDNVYCVGLPKVGPEIKTADDPEIVQVKDLQILLNISGIHDIVPVGSSGIRAETQKLAASVNCMLIVEPFCVLDIDKSAGPSTCVIFTSPSSLDLALELSASSFPRLSITKVGKFTKI